MYIWEKIQNTSSFLIKIRKLSDKMRKISEIKIKLTTQKINVILPVSQNQLAITNQRGEKVDEEKDGIFNQIK